MYNAPRLKGLDKILRKKEQPQAQLPTPTKPIGPPSTKEVMANEGKPTWMLEQQMYWAIPDDIFFDDSNNDLHIFFYY